MSAPLECHSDHCITCSDEGVPMRVEKIDDERVLALCVAQDGAKSTVEIELVAPVEVGDELLVHAGVALVKR
jgi:hydrogenase expression/formation protein HypC